MNVDVVIHAHYEEELQVIARLLKRKLASFGPSVSFYFGVTKGISQESVLELESQNWVTKVFLVENLGRNFSTLLRFQRLEESKGALTLHVHTKRSPHLPRIVGRFWLLFLLHRLLSETTKSLTAQGIAQRSSSIYFPRLDFLVPRRSASLFDPKDLFTNPDKLGDYKVGQRLSFPVGGMFLADTEMLALWLKKVSDAGPVFEKHAVIHGKAEHFLERHIGFFFLQNAK